MEKNKKFIIIGVLVAVAVAIVFVLSNTSVSGASTPSQDNVAVSYQTLSQLSTIANNETLANRVGAGTIAGFMSLEGNLTSLNSSGKPVFLYIGADFCPFCAEARWGMILALMRFGNFTQLHYMTSSASDIYPNTPTFTFYNSSYSSQVIDFQEVELTTNKFNSSINSYPTLQRMDQQQSHIFSTFDKGGSIPFVDIANKSVMVGSPILGGLLTKYTWNEIISELNDTSSVPSQNVIGAANLYTANICKATNFTPAKICNQPYVKAILAQET
ncbi:MAG: DUF929 family protein [Candidatus Micrarchaeaceae archaeon]